MQSLFEALAWTEQDIEGLIGQPESFRLEFKSGRMFAARETAIEKVSKEVSAFANSEGGVVVLGVSEDRRGKLNVAESIDGLDPDAVPTAWLQQAVEGNVSPPVPNIRFRTIPLSSPAGHVCIVIVVPPGSTAHQAQDRRYYGRSEFEAKPLADHDVRFRMQRGRVKRARVKISRWLSRQSFETSEGMSGPADFEQNPDVRLRHIMELSELAERLHETEDRGVPNVLLAFALKVVNEGELTIRDLSVEVSFKRDTSASLWIGDDHADIELEMPYRWDLPSGSRIHPQQTLELPLPLWTVAALSVPLGVGEAVLRWTAFVDDAAPERGEIDLAVETDAGNASGGNL